MGELEVLTDDFLNARPCSHHPLLPVPFRARLTKSQGQMRGFFRKRAVGCENEARRRSTLRQLAVECRPSESGLIRATTCLPRRSLSRPFAADEEFKSASNAEMVTVDYSSAGGLQCASAILFDSTWPTASR